MVTTCKLQVVITTRINLKATGYQCIEIPSKKARMQIHVACLHFLIFSSTAFMVK